MRFDWSTLALQTVNFAVLVWLLHRFLYKPVLRMIDARRTEVEKGYADARAAEDKAKETLASIETRLTGIAAEREVALKAAAAQAEEAAKARHAQAERDAAALLDATRKTLAAERDQLLAEARRIAFDLGEEIAHRLLDEMPAKPRGEAWLDAIERHLAGLPTDERGALLRQIVDGRAVTVVTASALPAEAAVQWRQRLQHELGDSVAIAFDVDSSLIAGAELHLPNAVLRFSWQSALAAIRAEIDTHDDAR